MVGLDTITVFNENNYERWNKTRTELAAVILFVINLEETSYNVFMHYEKSMKSGDIRNTGRRHED